MPKDPYALLRALLRAEAARDSRADKTRRRPDERSLRTSPAPQEKDSR
ncbi:hypothetical protein ACVHNB_40035 [Streptomyces sp. YJ-C3]